MSDNFYQINNISMSNNSSYNAIAESNDPLQYIVYPTKQDHIVSPENSKVPSKEEIKAQYFKRKSSSHCKSPDGSSQQNTRWTSKQFQDDFLSDDQSDEDNQEVRSKDSLFKKRLQESKKEQSDQLRNQYQSRDNRSLGLCDQDEDDEPIEKGNDEEDEVSSKDADEGEEDQNYESLSNKMKEIPTCKAIPCFQELDRQIKSLHELPSEMLQKQNFILGEKIPHYFDNLNMEDGFDEIDEVEENVESDKDSILNHRKKLSVNPIFHCNEIRLRFRVDSYNTGDENIYCQENDDIIVKNFEQLKKNHQKLKENKLKDKAQYHKSCINL